MKIEYFGHSCFRITSNKGTQLVTDPYTKVGYELPSSFSADIVTVSHEHFDHNYTQGVKNVKVVLSNVEAYAYKDIAATGFLCNHDEKGGVLRGKNIVFTISVDGVKICHLGDLGEPCSATLLSKIGNPDVLLIPVGGTYTIDALQAKEYVEKLQPKLVIPMHYKPSDGKLDITDEKSFLQRFDEVVYAPKNEAIDITEYLSDKMRILFMERKTNA